MKSLLHFGALVWVLALAFVIVNARSIENFEQFKKFYNKSYGSSEEENVRRQVFEQTLKYVQDHEKMASINEFSDLSEEEFEKMFLVPAGSLESDMTSYYQFTKVCSFSLKGNVPSSKDLRTEKLLTPIKHQGQCGSCWIFGVIAAVEGAFLSKRNLSLDLSEQEILDCTTSGSCSGGTAHISLDYIKTKGVVSGKTLHYTGLKTSCLKLNGERYKISDYCALYPTYDENIKQFLHTTNSPLVVGLSIKNVAAFQHYNGQNVIQEDQGSVVRVGHVIPIVGWTKRNGIDCWIVKNSWGTSWGDHGFGYIEQHKNLMNINNMVLVPML